MRHALWNVNEEHGATIQRLSGSPVAMYALDLNPSILTEDAEFVYFGPYMQYMSGVTDTQVKWTLENRSDNPGIRDGDMFLANDPWVGAAHQMDVMLLCPVFWKGELFCWVTNCLHQYDIGGITPGSFCPSARDAFDEGILIPPVKIVENNEIRRDIEEVYLRSSRKPSAVALDFRAQLAGNITARDRILLLIKRYGADTVKGVMRKILDDGEKAFLKKLARLPDGIWRDRTYVECCRPGDRQVHRVMLTLKKHKNKLVFENEGTDPQAGGINATYSGWRGAIMVAINELMCWEQYYAVGGALRHIDFNPTPGTLNCADFPASVSTAPVQCMEISLYPAYNVLSKMIYPGPRAAQGRDVHRRHQPVAGDHLPRHRPVGRALRLHPGRPDRRRDRRLLARRRHLDRRPGAHADLQAAQRGAHRAELSGPVPVSEGNHRLRRRRQVPRRPVRRVVLHPARHRPASRTTRCLPATPFPPRPG